MARPALFGVKASGSISVRVTQAQRVALERVARQNGMSLTSVIRDAVNEFVSDCRDETPFCHAERRDVGNIKPH
jgi:hypothetical protein